MNYTKGDWKVERPYLDKGFMISVRDKRGLLHDWIAEVQPTTRGEANAHLIAAAPEMHEALKPTSKFIDALIKQYPELDRDYRVQALKTTVDKALAKAEGK